MAAPVTAPADTRLIPVTPKAINTFTTCPRQYMHEYVVRPRPPREGGPWAHLTLGNVVHLALASWWDEPDGMRTPDAGAFLVAKAWHDGGFRDTAHSEAWRARAMQWVRTYLEGIDPDVRPLGIERTVSTKERGMALSGRADRIDLRQADGQDRLAVVDYKAGLREPDDWTAGSSVALAIYALSAGRMFRTRCDRAELHHLPTGEVAEVVYDQARIDRHMDRLAADAREMDAARQDYESAPDSADDIFPTNPGPLCASCSFRSHCPDGQAIPAATPWQYLPDPEETTP
jgi:putative RecB family exonuclease